MKVFNFINFWKAGIPMIISMVLQALYNIIDTAFVINMGPILGEKANLALTYAFPIQIFMIALGVGTGIGINALLSRYLGENNEKEIKKTVLNSLYIMILIYALFVIIGVFLSEPFIRMQSNGDQDVIDMGRDYLFIVCVFSLGNVGQFVAWGLAVLFHIIFNKEIKTDFKNFKPDIKCIGAIYKIGWSAAVMQTLLSIMMLGMNIIFKYSHYDSELLQGTFGIYYKIQQIPLFACFGMSNCLITLTAFVYGTKDTKRLKEVIKYGIIDTCIVGLIITILFEIFASQISEVFGLAGGGTSEEIINACVLAIRIASISYVFMAFTIGIQGILQGLRNAVSPLILSLLRLCVFVFPIAYAFTYLKNIVTFVWITFIISEFLTSIISFIVIKKNVNVNIKNK